MTAGAGDGVRAPSEATRRPTRSGRELWPFAVFLVLAIAFCAPALVPGRILMPSNPTFFQPWVDDPEAGALEGRSNGLMGDALIFTLPGRIWNHEMLSRGQIPLWNPYVFAGYPHLALIQNNALYPLSAPFDAIEPLSGLALSALLHFTLAGALMYVFLRRLGLDASAAAVGGVAFELNGMFLVRVSAPSYVYSGIWLPLLLLGAHSIAAAPRLRISLAVVVGTALSVLGGHPQITSLALALAGAYLVFEASARARAGGGRARAIARAALAFAASVVIAVGLAGFQVVPFLELMAHSAREVMSLEAYRASSLPFAGLLQAFVPDVFGNPVDRNYWLAKSAKLLDGLRPKDRFWAVNYSGGNVYTGIAPLVLAAIALLRSERRRETLFFALAAVASLGVLVGSPLLDLAYVAVPGFRYSRPDRVLFVYMGSVAVLSALGLEALLRRGDGATASANRARQALAVVILAAILIAWRVVPRVVDPAARRDLVAWVVLARGYWSEQASRLLPNALLQLAALVGCLAMAIPAVRRRLPRALWPGIWLVLLTLPNLVFGWRFNPAQLAPHFGTTEVERLLVERAGGGRIARILFDAPQFLPANVSQLIGLRDVNGASAAGVADYLGLIEAADPGSVAKQKYFRAFDHAAVASGPLLDVLSASVVVSDEDLDVPYESIASVGDVEIYRNPRALPRFRIVTAYDLVDSVEEARARLLAPGFDAAGRVLLSRPTSGTLPSPPTGGAVPSDLARVDVERDDPERIRLRVDAPADGILVTSEVFYPGWQARIDGVPTEVLRANAAFRAIVVPRGAHAVELSFEPRSLRVGAFVSLGSALVLVATLLANRRRAGASGVDGNGASARAAALGPVGS